MEVKKGPASIITVVPDSPSLTCSTNDPLYNGTKQSAVFLEESFSPTETEKSVQVFEDNWENDPENARNWPDLQRWIAMGIVSLYTFLPPLASCMMAPGLPEVADKYNITSSTVTPMTLSIFLLSFALGPLVLAPLSEMYGRKWVLHIGNLFTLAFSLGCAFSPNVGALITFRFLTGLSGSAPIAIGGGVVSDLFSERERASAMAIFCVGPLLGPAIGPVAGGFITETVGIKWVFIVIAISCAIASIIGIPFLRETYGPVIRLRQGKRSADLETSAKADPGLLQAQGSKLRILWVNLTRPLMLLCRSFVCFILSLYMSLLYGIYYLMFSTFPVLFSDIYGFNAGIGGLAYLGLGAGFMIATVAGAKFADRLYQYLAERNGGKGTPEMRMPALFFGSFFVPIGLFWYGWSAQARIHWIMPIIGTGIFGFALMTTFLPIQLYLVDAFTYSASALAAAYVFRSMLGFAFPLFGQQMYNKLGQGGGNSMLAGISIVLGIPFPVWIYYKGEAMRAKSRFTR